MAGFTIKALTENGTKALNTCIEEEKVELMRKSWLDRLKFHKIWSQTIQRTPLRYTWILNKDAERILHLDSNFSFRNIFNEIDVAMKKNGAEKDMDYTIEVLK